MSRKVLKAPCPECKQDHPRTLFQNGVCLFCIQKKQAAQAKAEAVKGLEPQDEEEKRRYALKKARQELREKTASARYRRKKAEAEAARAREEIVGDNAAMQELARQLLAEEHLLPFVKRFNPEYEAGWVHKDICEHLEWFSEAVANQESPRLAIFMPPRHGKSELASRSFPAWHLGRFPNHEVIASSYSGALAMGFSRKVRAILRDPAYQNVFENTRLDPESQSAEAWLTTEGGGYTAAGVGGAITGKGAHVLIIDDPVKNREEAESETARESVWDWYTSTAYTRLAPGGGVLLILTRWHDDDLAGRLLRKMAEGEGDEWKVVEYPAIAAHDELFRKAGEALHPERYPLKALQGIKRAIGPRDWSALYQQNPVADDGDFFTTDMFSRYRQQDLPPYDEMHFYTAWDLAIGQKELNDWSVGITVGVDRQDNLYVVDIQRGRWDTLQLADKILDVYETWRSTITGIERGQIELALGPILNKRTHERGLTAFSYEPLRPGRRDKVARARSIQGRMLQHKVFFRAHCDTTQSLINEMLRFPNGVHDDQVDAMAYTGLLLDEFVRPRAPKPKKKKGWRDKLPLATRSGRRHYMAA